MGQKEQRGGREMVYVCVRRAACVRVEGRKRKGYLRRPQRASSHLARMRGHSRGHCWPPAGQPPGASCHPSHRAEPSDPIYQEGTQKKKKRLTVMMKDEVSKARPPGMHGLTPKPIATKEPVAAMAVGLVATPHGRRSATF